MIKKFIIIFHLLTFANITNASAKFITIDVKGLVCEFCAVTIKKNFMKKEQVKKVTVDLVNGKVFIDLKEGQNLSDQVISELIINNGYNLSKIIRDEK
jgi:mercuric ion binding protein